MIQSLWFLIKKLSNKLIRTEYAAVGFERLLKGEGLFWLTGETTARLHNKDIIHNGEVVGHIISNDYVLLYESNDLSGALGSYVVQKLKANPENTGV